MPKKKRGPQTKVSEPGQRFIDVVMNWGDSLTSFYETLSSALPNTSAATIEVKISNFINGHEAFPARYIYQTEHILGIRIADIIDGAHITPASPKGLYEVGTYGKYEDFEWLSKQTDGSIEVIKTYDEWSKSIFNYVYDAKNLEGLRYLVDHDFYHIFGPGKFTAYSYHSSSEEEHALILLKMMAEDSDPKASMFIKLFDSKDHIDTIDLNGGLFNNEVILKTILDNKNLLNAVMRDPEYVSESILNNVRRATKQEYKAVCASSWLTPVLCYALAHEEEYPKEANLLCEKSLEIAQIAEHSIAKNIELLGGTDDSISTKNGQIILGHRYVIGIIGEPQTDGIIKDANLKKQVDDITSVIGSFRTLSKFQTPIKVNGKLHLPRVNRNKIYRTFIKASKGHKYLLQESNSNDGDSYNYVFDAPKGNEAHGELSLKQWKQLGQALHSIHDIPTGQDGKAFCHGRFSYPNIYITDDGNIELVAGYHNVYIGSPEEDVFAMTTLAFKNEYPVAQTNQDTVDALLEGYGYPKEGFMEKLWNYLITLARNESNMNEARFLMDYAMSVLRVIKATK